MDGSPAFRCAQPPIPQSSARANTAASTTFFRMVMAGHFQKDFFSSIMDLLKQKFFYTHTM
jgi:hypothetical protein